MELVLITDDFNDNVDDLKNKCDGQSDENNNDSGVYVLNGYEIEAAYSVTMNIFRKKIFSF